MVLGVASGHLLFKKECSNKEKKAACTSGAVKEDDGLKTTDQKVVVPQKEIKTEAVCA